MQLRERGTRDFDYPDSGLGSEQGSLGRVSTDRASTGQASTDQASTGRASTDQASTGQASTGQTSTIRASTASRASGPGGRSGWLHRARRCLDRLARRR